MDEAKRLLGDPELRRQGAEVFFIGLSQVLDSLPLEEAGEFDMSPMNNNGYMPCVFSILGSVSAYQRFLEVVQEVDGTGSVDGIGLRKEWNKDGDPRVVVSVLGRTVARVRQSELLDWQRWLSLWNAASIWRLEGLPEVREALRSSFMERERQKVAEGSQFGQGWSQCPRG